MNGRQLQLAGGVEETVPANQPGYVGAMPTPRSFLDEFADVIPSEQMTLVDVPPINAPLVEVQPGLIAVRQVSFGHMVSYQRSFSRAVWKPHGRNLGFTINHADTIIAIVCLSSPTINRIPARDDFLGLPLDDSERGYALRAYADLSVCVGVQPLAWHWNIGKLAALIATTLGDFWLENFGDSLRGIITTSLWGKGAQYNGVYRHLGYTRGNGTSHLPDWVFDVMRDRLSARDWLPTFGPRSTNPRMKLAQAYARRFGTESLTFHGDRRAIYYHEATHHLERQHLVRHWFERWGLPRYRKTRERTPPYLTGAEEGLSA